MDKEPTIHNHYYGMTFQNCTIPNATFQTINQAPGVATRPAPPAPCTDADTFTPPAGLDTPEARALMDRLVQAGLLDGRWQPDGLSIAQKGVLAWQLGARLNLKTQWKAFSSLWGMNADTLRQGYNNGINQVGMGTFLDRMKEAMGG